ncbi:hypothetical protein YPPY45_0371, partial [Yersinia pestis PY-45]|jgi:mannose-6-phosphate isomerase-like protein (cupin superfamily)
MPRG